MPSLRREPLTRVLGAQRTADAQLRKVLEEAARDARRAINRLGNNYGDQVRRLQLQLAEQQLLLWTNDIDGVMRLGLGNSFDAAAGLLDDFDRMVFKAGGIDPPPGWERSMYQQAREGLNSYLARMSNGISLSNNVYRNAALASGRIDRIVNSALLRGASARELARDVYGFISTRVPGGVSYAAQRLARTEINNAFHRHTTDHWAGSPFVTGQKWNLSGSHPKPDICDDYANDRHMPRGDPGVYRSGDVPPKPHPQCFCYVTPQTMSDAELLRGFRSGRFDSWVAGQMP